MTRTLRTIPIIVEDELPLDDEELLDVDAAGHCKMEGKARRVCAKET
jgi:hypothetical protein